MEGLVINTLLKCVRYLISSVDIRYKCALSRLVKEDSDIMLCFCKKSVFHGETQLMSCADKNKECVKEMCCSALFSSKPLS